MQKISINSANIRISENTCIFDTGTESHVDICVEKWITVFYCFVPSKNGEYSRSIILDSDVVFHGSALLVLENGSLQITSEIRGDSTKSDLQLLTLAKNTTSTTVEGVAKVDKPYRHVSTRVDQTNILLGNGARVRWVPRLEIATDDIEGGHSCKIHRIRSDAAFYLESRWLSPVHAETLLLNSEILRHLITIVDEEERRWICYNIHQMLLKG